MVPFCVLLPLVWVPMAVKLLDNISNILIVVPPAYVNEENV
jgi:hypothetical protein